MHDEKKNFLRVIHEHDDHDRNHFNYNHENDGETKMLGNKRMNGSTDRMESSTE